MNHLPDAGTLDALVIGADEPDDREAWEALVTLPGGAEAWLAAVARRRRMDQLAAATRGRPWLARAILLLSRSARKLRSIPGIGLSVEHLDREMGALAEALLGSGEQLDNAQPVRPIWGQIVTIRVNVGERIKLSSTSEEAPIDVRYLCNGQSGALPTRIWELEPGEAPVLLLALAGTSPDRPQDEAMAHATGLAGVLLLELEANGETTS
jgi:hypothetical protein